MVICLSGRAVCESPHSFLPIWQHVQQLVLSIRPWFKRSHLLELDSACLTAFRTKQNCSLKVYEKQWSMSQTVQAQSLLPYVFQSPPDVLQLSANTSWECATPGAGALVDSLSIRHSYNRRRQCTFYFLSYTNYTELKKKNLYVCVCLCVPGYRCPWWPNRTSEVVGPWGLFLLLSLSLVLGQEVSGLATWCHHDVPPQNQPGQGTKD